eukprot:777084_1
MTQNSNSSKASSMESKWFINHQDHKDNIIYLNGEEAMSLKSPKDMYEGRLETIIQPGLNSRRSIACPSKDPRCTKPHIKHDVDKNETEIDENQADVSSIQGCMLPTPQSENGDPSGKSWTPSPTSHIPRNTLIL